MRALTIVMSVALLAFTGAAVANPPSKPPRLYTAAHQPKGAPTKASSFAPRPGNKRHVYGAPIQSPILKRTAIKPSKAPTSATPQPPPR